MRKSWKALFLLAFACFSVQAASDTISGVVGDSTNSLALKNVWVKVVGSAYKDSLFTDSLGRFSFLRPISSVNMSSIENLPAKTFLRFSNGNFQWQNQAGKITVEMVSVQGKIVSSFSDNKTSGFFRVPSIATGLYFIRFRSAEQTDVYRYLHLAGNKSSLSAQAEVRPTAEFLAKKTAAVACTLSFEKIPYRTILLPLAKAQTGLQIKMQIPANAIYRIYGMNFSPYTGTQNPNTGFVVSEKQIIERMRIIAPYTKVIRTFSATHGQEVCGRIAHLFGLKIYVNAWIGPDSVANNKEMDSLIAMAKRGEVDTAVIGSEALLRGDITEAKLIALINRFRTAVPNVPVTTADVYGQLIGHPNVIAACDFVFANFYPYWEGVKIDYAVASLYDSYQNLVKISGGKEVIISEAGWPSAGATFAESVPSPENAAFYLLNFVSWARATNVKIFSFEAFDEPWKTSEGTVGANWGIFDKDGVMKPGMQKVFDGDTMANNWTGGDTVDGPGTPTITFTFVPAIGSAENLRGKVSHVVPKNYGIAIYIKVAGGWWQKPTYAQPVTKINIDGTWVCDFTTGGNDASATEITAFLIPSDYAPPTSYSAVAADKIVAKLNVVR